MPLMIETLLTIMTIVMNFSSLEKYVETFPNTNMFKSSYA